MLQDERQAGAKIEITAEMIDAGVRELLSLLDCVVSESPRFLNEHIAISVYASMVEASITPCSGG